MELTKLSLTNFRSHRKLELDFTSGITGIVGDNGKGKSSIVEAIIFLFTGEGYGAKSDMISVGESTGYVVGQLKIDGKEATLERHLDTSKVAFKYEGITYKKSGEVAEIWDRLFQIDKNIFKNIVVAKQGDIALLFSGDNSIKEKIFQKIFLVPNTTKVRDTIWNKYIKAAPPEYPAGDVNDINRRILDAEGRINSTREELKLIPEDLTDVLAGKLSRENYLKGVLGGEAKSNELKEKLKQVEEELSGLSAQEGAINERLGSININDVVQLLEELKAVKPIWERKVALEETLRTQTENLVTFTPEEQEKMTALTGQISRSEAELSVLTDELSGIRKNLEDYAQKGLLDAQNCPTCGAALEDSKSYIEHLRGKIPKLEGDINNRTLRLEEARKSLREFEGLMRRWDTQNRELQKTRSALEAIGNVNYDGATHTVYTNVLSQYRELEQELGEVQRKKNEKEPKVMETKLAILGIPVYDNARPSLQEEILEITGDILRIREEISKRARLETQNSTAVIELETAKGDLARAEVTLEMNKKRNNYVGVLNNLYEMLHTSEFPRKLIQTYSSTVSEYLADNLRQFNFPYRAEVNDNFGIDVFDNQDRKLPSVSGGQEIMIGVALRLALHSMFGSAFPMMIFDEGSVHLSQESKRSYFEIIQNMKSMSNFKQVIIIDHDEDLAGVVDNTIKL